MTIVNTVATYTNTQYRFAIGLAFAQFTEFMMGSANSHAMLSLAVDAVGAAIFAALGYFTPKQHWLFYAGFVLYGIDGALLILMKDYDLFGIGLHLFVYFCLYQGIQASKQLTEIARLERLDQSLPSLLD